MVLNYCRLVASFRRGLLRNEGVLLKKCKPRETLCACMCLWILLAICSVSRPKTDSRDGGEWCTSASSIGPSKEQLPIWKQPSPPLFSLVCMWAFAKYLYKFHRLHPFLTYIEESGLHSFPLQKLVRLKFVWLLILAKQAVQWLLILFPANSQTIMDYHNFACSFG